MRALFFAVLLAGVSLLPYAVFADKDTREESIVSLVGPLAAQRFTPTDEQTTISAGNDASASLVITIQPGPTAYPGVELKAENGSLDFSSFGYVEASITNPDKAPLVINFRVDNLGARGTFWITEHTTIDPGATSQLRVYLGKPVNGFRADKITRLYFFTLKVEGAPRSFRIESLVSGGKPGDMPVVPADVRTVPRGGVLFGADTAVDLARQFVAKGGAALALENKTLQATLPATAGADAVVTFKPTEGCWDLRDALQVRITVKNTGSTAVTPQIHLDSTYGPTDTISASAPLPPGQETEIAVPFIALKPWTHTPAQESAAVSAGSTEAQGPFAQSKTAAMWGPAPGTGSKFISNAVQAVGLTVLPAGQARTVAITSIRADLPPIPAMPDWVGKRPPVEGDWVKTFDDEFDGTTLDTSKWGTTGGQWYDPISHYSTDNVIVGSGMARLRYEKKTGHHNDDPKQFQTDYATGYLDTTDKWRQRYGYFECRMKLPTAPGLWPAFWMMPNRPGAERPGVRGRTSDGAMEFDIVEWLSIWGPYRYNIAMHWDGYQTDHKSAGSKVFFQPDKDGFITAGLLWTPRLRHLLRQRQGDVPLRESAGFRRSLQPHSLSGHGRLG